MKIGTAGTLTIFAGFALVGSALAQDLGPQVKKLADGVYVVAGNNFFSNAGIVLTQDGVMVIDTTFVLTSKALNCGGLGEGHTPWLCVMSPVSAPLHVTSRSVMPMVGAARWA